MAAACHDRAHVGTEGTNYVYHPVHLALPAHGPCTAPPAAAARTRCVKGRRSIHHPATNDFMSCSECNARCKDVTGRLRSDPVVPPVYQYRPEPDVVSGQAYGAWYRGELCDLCINQEILNFHVRHFIEKQPMNIDPQGRVNTCKCHAELASDLCVRDRISAIARIQAETDRIAGNRPNWLSTLEYDAVRGCAVRTANAAALTLRRTANNLNEEACRCGRDVSAAGPAPPVHQCTACSGIVVDRWDPRVTGFTAVRITRSQTARTPALQRGTRETDLKYGRRLR